MSTRAIIAFPDEKHGWIGTYHHSDGYSSGLGVILLRCLEMAEGDVAMLRQRILDDHPGGWSLLPDACYCHDRGEGLTVWGRSYGDQLHRSLARRLPGGQASLRQGDKVSRYLTFQDVCFTSQELLLQALKACGYAEVETGESLVLYGYHGDARPERAQLVIRRRHVGRASNDIGFTRTDKGYVPIVSEYDQSVKPRFLVDLRTRYSELVVQVVARRLGGTVQVAETGGVKRMVVNYA